MQKLFFISLVTFSIHSSEDILASNRWCGTSRPWPCVRAINPWEKIQLDYIDDIKELLKTFQSEDNINAQERNFLIHKTIQSLNNKKIREYPAFFLHNLAARIKNDLFEKNPLIFSQREKDIFIHQLRDIVEKTELKYTLFNQELFQKNPTTKN